MKTPDSAIDFAARFRERYGDNIFAFEHRSLTESPIQNALELAEALPKGAELHLVTHSRGGMVGDLIALGQLEGGFNLAIAEQLFAGRPDQAALSRLIDTLKDKQPRVSRYIRVACPARGTSLASKRADRWFSMLLSLLGKILDHFASPIIGKLYEALQDFLLAVAAERLDPLVMPGIEAMMPGSPLVRLLNLPNARSTADLNVIAGSAEGKGFLSKLKYFPANQFYGGQHDLVVNCASMDGGIPRTVERLFPSNGSDVNHLSYFYNATTRKALLEGLTLENSEDAGFKEFDWKQADIPARAVPVDFVPGSRPVVVLLPGLLGSSLKAAGDRIWLDYWNLTVGGLDRLKIDAKDVEADDIIRSHYQTLIQFLSNTHQVVPFPYDWRVSMQGEAGRLAVEVRRWLTTAPAQPVRILAHAEGGLLVRLMFAQDPSVWRDIKARSGGRFVMLGTPNEGTYETLRMLTGESRVIRQLGLVDLRHSTDQILDIVSRYPGLLESLPPEAGPDLFRRLDTIDPRVGARVKDLLENAAKNPGVAQSDSIR